MDILELEPEVLETTADIIGAYCKRQTAIMDDYLSKNMMLSAEWTDDQTFGLLLDEVKRLRDRVVLLMDEINMQYPKYFKAKAEKIRQIPKFGR